MSTLTRILIRRDTAANWTSDNPTLAAGEYGVDLTTNRFKVGDGTTAWNSLHYQGVFGFSGSRVSPLLITAVGGLTPHGLPREYQFIKGNGGPITVTANPQIAAGTMPGQELVLTAALGADTTFTVTLANGNGLVLNGNCVFRNGASLYLVWDGTFWAEVSRNDV